MISRSLFTGGAMLALTIGAAGAQAKRVDPKHRQFDYFLPQLVAGASVTQRIMSCPAKAEDAPEIETVIEIDGNITPDTEHMLTIDARSGFLSKRSTTIEAHADGTLGAFNASSEGQGGPVISSILSAVGVVAPWVAPARAAAASASVAAAAAAEAPKQILFCSDEIKEALRDLGEIREKIASLDALILTGKSDESKTESMARLRERANGLLVALTLSAGRGPRFIEDGDYYRGSAGTATSGHKNKSGVIAPVDYTKWFVTADGKPAKKDAISRIFPQLPGRFGFLVTLTPHAGLLRAFKGDGQTSFAKIDRRAVFYRRPVPAMIEVNPCESAIVAPGTPMATCQVQDAVESSSLSKSQKLMIPQLSGLYSLSIGKGGLFGTREATLKFDADGAPTTFAYGSSPGGAEMASTLDSATATATALHDAQFTADKSRGEKIKARKDLAALLADE